MKRTNILTAELRTVEAKLKTLEAKLGSLSAERQKLEIRREYLRKCLQGHHVIDLSTVPSNLTESILFLLNDSPESLTVHEIYQQLLGGGFQSKSKDFYTSVFVMCKKLSQRHLISETVKANKRAYEKISP